jgi:hypothetical protein
MPFGGHPAMIKYSPKSQPLYQPSITIILMEVMKGRDAVLKQRLGFETGRRGVQIFPSLS